MTDTEGSDDPDDSSPDADESDGESGDGGTGGVDDEPPRDRLSIITDQREEINRLRSDLEDLQERVDERTVARDSLEGDLRRYVRRRLRRGHARGWGPYLVLLYGTLMTLGAFVYVDGGLWAILAMILIWLSTLGLYALMLIVGAISGGFGLFGRAFDWAQERR
jgi:hypothetical protein